MMGKWQPGHHLDEKDAFNRAKLLLSDCIDAKHKHIHSGKCEVVDGGSPDSRCCACHYWQGSINALEEVLFVFD